MSSTGEAEHRYNQYDTLGRVQDTRVVMRRADNQQKIQHTDIAYHGAPGTTDPSLGYDAAGNLRGQVQTTNGNTGDATRTTYKYQFNGSYQQTESTTTQGGTTATTNTWRDANGFISNIEQQGGVVDNRYNRAFVNDAQGNALYVNQSAGASNDKGSRIQNDPGGYIGGFIGDAINPGHIQRQLVANGEVLARYGDAPDSENPPQNGAVPKYVNTAEFHLDAPALKLRDTSFSAMSYTVVGGQTLKTIARNVLGDSSLWWRIAEANGLAVSGGGELKAGQTLSIPKLALNANNADTFQPYDPSRVTGSLDSVLPAPAGQGGGCGALGKIIMVAVAVAVTVFSGGFGSPVAAALGSIAGQATGNLLGVQDGFSWKSVALSALSAGLANNLPLPDLGSAWQNAAVRMGTVNALTQGIGVVTGLQDRFDWKSVAASAAGGAMGSYVDGQLKTSTMFSDWSKTAADLARGTISAFAAGTTAAVARGGRISIQQVATDAFGNALGSSLASASSGVQAQGQGPWSDTDYRNGSDIQSDNAYMQRQREALYGFSTASDSFGLKADGGFGLNYAGVRATPTVADDTRVFSDSRDPFELAPVGQDGRPTAQVLVPPGLGGTGGIVGGGYQVVRPAGAGAPPPYDLRADKPNVVPGYALPDIKLGAGTPPLVNGIYSLINLATEGFARPAQSLVNALSNLTYMAPGSSNGGSNPVYQGVEIIDHRGSPLGEFDRIEGTTLIEEKSANGLDKLNPRTGLPFQTPQSWAEKQIYEKTVVRIENLNNATSVRPTLEGTPMVPTLDEIRSMRNLEFRIDNSNSQVQSAVEFQLNKLRQKYSEWNFGAKFGR